MFLIGSMELKITLFGKAVFFRGLDWANPFTLTFNEHGKLAGNRVAIHHRERTVIANDGPVLDIELHLQHLHYTSRTNGSERSWSIAERAAKVKLNMAV